MNTKNVNEFKQNHRFKKYQNIRKNFKFLENHEFGKVHGFEKMFMKLKRVTNFEYCS